MRHYLTALTLLTTLLLPSCASVDMEGRVRDRGPARQGGPAVITVPVETGPPPPPEIIERPVYVPREEAPPAAAPPAGRAAVAAANAGGILEPSEYSRAAMVYDFHGDFVYEVHTQPLRATDIRLEPGERAAEPPFISDSDRWMIGAGVSHENGVPVQHIYVKPVQTGIEASLIINTDRRAYHVILKSFASAHMPIVRWRYPRTGMPSSYVAVPGDRGGAPGSPPPEGGIAGVDPRFLSFDYRVTWALFRRPPWLPSLVYDDGQKTYVVFPESVLQRELPAVFENRNDVVNYRVIGNIVIIDRLVERLTVRIERAEITVEKKRGGRGR